ncbi:hypothetical protein SNEBB_010094 [Seison nebaliae]|nr:hypothetical protein SNEBB_010094 [Seison nebaliae]
MDDLFGPISSNEPETTISEPKLIPESSPVQIVIEESPVEEDAAKEWPRKFKERLESKDATEDAKIQEMQEHAKKELDDWYQKRKEQIEKKAELNLLEQNDFIESNKKSNTEGIDWKDVVKFCEFNSKVTKNEKDTSRLRSLLLNLKDAPLAT